MVAQLVEGVMVVGMVDGMAEVVARAGQVALVAVREVGELVVGKAVVAKAAVAKVAVLAVETVDMVAS